MKTGTFDTVSVQKYITALFIVTAAVLIFAGASFAQELNLNAVAGSTKVQLKPNAFESLITGLKSENDGLRKSSVYFAGVYEVEGAVPVLVKMLNNEKNENIRILAAFALYRIGSKEALSALSDNADRELNPELQAVCSEIRISLAKTPKAINISTK